MKQPTLAVAMIVKNEEKHLQSCLEAVTGWVDEIIILDSGSTDNTEVIARKFTDKYYSNLDWPGFGKQRQIAQQYVTSDYVLWLDADERVTPELKLSIISALKNGCTKKNIAYKINRLNYYFGQPIRYSGYSPDWIVRLYRTNEIHYNDALVHESVNIDRSFKVIKLNGRLLHFTLDNIFQYQQKTKLYIKSWVDQREAEKSSSLFKAIFHALFRFIKMYILKFGFLDGRYGFLLAMLSANTVFTRYADLWLRNHKYKK